MRKMMESVEELYRMDEATGEVIVDEVVRALRKSSTQWAGDIAILLNVDRRSLSIAFELLTGMPLNKMVREWRLLQARDLLSDMSLSVQEVANRCGFKQQKNLITAFRKRFGTTPYAFRTGKIIRNSNYLINRQTRKR